MSEYVLAIRPRKHYREGMSQKEIYQITRGVWSFKPERYLDMYLAMTFINGIVIEVFEIENWHQAYTTKNEYPWNPKDYPGDGRVEFTGKVAGKSIRDKYIGKHFRYKQVDANPARRIPITAITE